MSLAGESFRGLGGACLSDLMTQSCQPPPVQSNGNDSSEDGLAQQEKCTFKPGELQCDMLKFKTNKCRNYSGS